MFISSCHSEGIGKVFFENGVKHVICIRQDEQVSDEVANIFANQFYELLFKNDLPICQVFYQTLINIENNKNNKIMHESRKFLMFREVDYPYKSEKYVTNENQKLQMRTDFYRQMLNFDHKKCQCSSLQSN